MLCDLAAYIHSVNALHQHLRLDDGDQPGLLAQRSIARQRVGVGVDASATGRPLADGEHRTPLGEARAHLRIFNETCAQPVQALSDLLSRKCRHRLCPGIDLDAGNDSSVHQGFGERRGLIRPLPDRLIEEDCAADRLTQAGRRHNQVPVLPPRLRRLRDVPLGKSFVARPDALVDGDEPFAVGDHLLCGPFKLMHVHLVLLHFQLRISGMSWPCSSM